MNPEELFVALDGRSLTGGNSRYRIEVFSVRDEAEHRWVQLALKDDDKPTMLTMRLRTGDGVEQALLALRAWLTDPAAARDVFNVA